MLPLYYQRLPTLTEFYASDAKMLGAFGLVGQAITITYHRLPHRVGLDKKALPNSTRHYRTSDLALPRS